MNTALLRKTSIQTMISSSFKTALHHTTAKQLKIFFETTHPISLAYKNGHRIRQIWIRWITQFGISCKNLSTKKGVNHCESQSTSECYQRQMAWCRWPDSQKSSIAVEKALSSCGKAEWRTYSAHFLLISLLIRITVTFCVTCVQPTT